MKKYTFYLQRYQNRRFYSKRLVIESNDAVAVRQQVEKDYPEWQISMFWMNWP